MTQKAIKCALNQWENFIGYCEHSQLDISNIKCENAIKPFAVGRRGWLFSDTPKGARADAVYYKLIETAKANGLDSYCYILHLCSHIASAETAENVEALLPWNVKVQLTQQASSNA